MMRSYSACVIVGGMGERTGAGSAPRPVPKFEVDVGVAAEQLQHAADGVGMVIVAVATVIDRVFSASVDPALKQAQLSEKLEAVAGAARSAHVPTFVNTYHFKAMLEMLCGDAPLPTRPLNSLVELSREHGIQHRFTVRRSAASDADRCS